MYSTNQLRRRNVRQPSYDLTKTGSFYCLCASEKIDKNTPGSGTLVANTPISTKMRVAQVIRSAKRGGTFQWASTNGEFTTAAIGPVNVFN